MLKGEKTREKILEKAAREASVCGLEDISIGNLAKATGLSKSGLFAHFNSKENLQAQIINWVSERYREEVMLPAFREPRGVPRIRAIYQNWRDWIDGGALPGGCVVIASAMEFDDRPGVVRDEVVQMMKRLLNALCHAAELAVDEGHFAADADTKQFAFEFEALMHGYHQYSRLLQDPSAGELADVALEKLLGSFSNPT
jgi:AcrR family transcriptional regulator